MVSGAGGESGMGADASEAGGPYACAAGAGGGRGAAATGAESGTVSMAPLGNAGAGGATGDAGVTGVEAAAIGAGGATATCVGAASPPVRYSTGAGGALRAHAQSALAAVRIAMSPELRITSESYEGRFANATVQLDRPKRVPRTVAEPQLLRRTLHERDESNGDQVLPLDAFGGSA